jgi:NADH:ubiquinone oxidoreductase subunit E
VSVEDNERSGRQSTSKTIENVEKIQELIHEDHRRKIHELADTTGISYRDCQEILTENVNMHGITPSSRQRARPHVPENHRVCD